MAAFLEAALVRADACVEVTEDAARVVHGAGVVARRALARDATLVDALAPLRKVQSRDAKLAQKNWVSLFTTTTSHRRHMAPLRKLRDFPLPPGFEDGEDSERVLMLHTTQYNFIPRRATTSFVDAL